LNQPGAGLGERPRLIVALVDDRDQLRHGHDAALDLASRHAACVILYDRDAADVLGDPMPTPQSAQGKVEEFGVRCRRPSWRSLDKGS
jgi:hypothetical protein